ncbi:MAG: hypothetical protein K6G00_00880 [Treponema sp.]|nr:hypothetical protein [Treponema sp.]
MMKRFIFTALCVFAFFMSARTAQCQNVIGDRTSVPQGSVMMLDDFEKGNYWIWAGFDWEQWGPSKLSTSVRISNQWASQGRQSLECKVIKSTPDSDKDGMYFMDYSWDFTGAKYIVLDIYNPNNKSFEFGIAFQVTEDWSWKETSNVIIGPGKHTVVLSLDEFKEDLYLVKRVNICYREKDPIRGNFYIDNMRFIK